MFQKEPAVILGALSEVVRAVIPTLIIFGYIQWTGEQVAQFMLLAGVMIGFFNVLLTRSQVVPTEKVNQQIQVGIDSPSHTTVEQVIAKTEAANQ